MAPNRQDFVGLTCEVNGRQLDSGREEAARLDPARPQLRPEIFSHAPVPSRAVWFERGRESRDPAVCDPFPNE